MRLASPSGATGSAPSPGRGTGAARVAPRLAFVALAAGDAWWIAVTRPFTDVADVAVLAGGALVVGAAGLRWRSGDAPGDGPAAGGATPQRARRPSIAAWVVVATAVVCFEVATLAAGAFAGRHGFPTVSSLYDAAAHVRYAKALVALVWLGLGWALFGP